MTRERKERFDLIRVDFRNLHRESRESKRVIIGFKIRIKRVIGSSISYLLRNFSLAFLIITEANYSRGLTRAILFDHLASKAFPKNLLYIISILISSRITGP